MKNGLMKLTSVKIKNDLHRKFKIKCIEDDITIQKILNRSIHLYLNNNDFKKKILETTTIGNNL
jgi:hypothetical protein